MLYVLHNVFYASFSLVAGWLGDRFPKNLLLAGGYSLAGVMTLLIIVLPVSIWSMAAIFVVGGIYIAMEETLEDSLCAELVDESLTAWRLASSRR
jgi:MFS family permease